MKKVHSKSEAANPIVHFKLEIKETKASIELHGKTNHIANGICSAMQQKPDLAAVIMEAAVYYTNTPDVNETPKTQK